MAPVTYDESSLRRYATAWTTSELVPSRLSGTALILAAATASGSREKYGEPEAACSLFWLSHMKPGPRSAGLIALTRMPSGARSFAVAVVIPITADFDATYATIVGAFERRNCALQVASPVEDYLLRVDAMEEGAEKAAVTAVTAPILDALDDAYATPCEGAGLFPLQATLNHNCEPNVTLVKEEGDEERDCRVFAR